MSLETNSFEFGGFVLDCGDRVLLSGGKPVPLTPKAFALLKTLVENHGRVMEKQELMEAVWPDSFVEEGNLPYTANLLRKTLGDSKDEPRFIETVSRRGYRFIAPVTRITRNGEHERETSPKAGARGAMHQWRRAAGISAGAVLVILAISGIWFATRAQRDHRAPILAQPFSVEQISNSGRSQYAAISPDGRYAVYADEAGGRQSLWLRSLDTSENVQIVPPSEDEYIGMTFSNDGKSLFFVRKRLGVHALPSLYRIEPFGGVPVKVINYVNERVSLSPDDSQIAFVRCRFRGDDFCSAYVADADGKNERLLLTTPNGVHIWEVRFSPDGRSLAIARGRYSNDKNDSSIIEWDLATGQEREFFGERFFKITGLEWSPDGTGVIFSAPDFNDGKAAVWMADRSNGKLTMLTKDAASYSQLALDKAGGRMIAIQEVPNFRVHTVNGADHKVLTGGREVAYLDSDKLVFSTFDGELWSMRVDGSEQRQLTRTKSAESSLQSAPDGRTIFFSSDEAGSRTIWSMSADGSEKKQLTTDKGGFPVGVTADGRYVFYTLGVGGGLYKVSSAGGEPELIHSKALINPAVSPEGNFAAYFVLENMVRKIAVMDLFTKETVATIAPDEGATFTRTLAWSKDGRELHYVQALGGGNTRWQWSRDSGPQKIAELSQGEVLSFALSESGGFSYVAGDWRYDVMLLRGLK